MIELECLRSALAMGKCSQMYVDASQATCLDPTTTSTSSTISKFFVFD